MGEVGLRRVVIGCAILVGCRGGLLVMTNTAFAGSLVMWSAFAIGTTGGKLREGSRMALWLGLIGTLHAATGVVIAAWAGVSAWEWAVRIAYLPAALGLAIAAQRLRRVETQAAVGAEEHSIP